MAALAAVLLGAAWAQDWPAPPAPENPIHVTFVIHFDPLPAPGGDVLRRAYESERDNLQWLADWLDRLERENRSLTRWAWFLLVGLAAVVLMGQAAPRASLKVVEAERFILIGRSGKPRAVLTEASDGNVGLRFVDTSGEVRMALSVEGNGQPNLALSDSKGRRRIGMTVSTDGSVTFGILDAAEKDRAGLGLSSDGMMGFFLSDRDNARRMILGVGPEGSPGIALYGKTNGARVIAVAKEDAPPQLVLFDKAGKAIWKAP